jgi:hypothetical protein
MRPCAHVGRTTADRTSRRRTREWLGVDPCFSCGPGTPSEEDQFSQASTPSPSIKIGNLGCRKLRWSPTFTSTKEAPLCSPESTVHRCEVPCAPTLSSSDSPTRPVSPLELGPNAKSLLGIPGAALSLHEFKRGASEDWLCTPIITLLRSLHASSAGVGSYEDSESPTLCPISELSGNSCQTTSSS